MLAGINEDQARKQDSSNARNAQLSEQLSIRFVILDAMIDLEHECSR